MTVSPLGAPNNALFVPSLVVARRPPVYGARSRTSAHAGILTFPLSWLRQPTDTDGALLGDERGAVSSLVRDLLQVLAEVRLKTLALLDRRSSTHRLAVKLATTAQGALPDERCAPTAA